MLGAARGSLQHLEQTPPHSASARPVACGWAEQMSTQRERFLWCQRSSAPVLFKHATKDSNENWTQRGDPHNCRMTASSLDLSPCCSEHIQSPEGGFDSAVSEDAGPHTDWRKSCPPHCPPTVSVPAAPAPRCPYSAPSAQKKTAGTRTLNVNKIQICIFLMRTSGIELMCLVERARTSLPKCSTSPTCHFDGSLENKGIHLLVILWNERITANTALTITISSVSCMLMLGWHTSLWSFLRILMIYRPLFHSMGAITAGKLYWEEHRPGILQALHQSEHHFFLFFYPLQM